MNKLNFSNKTNQLAKKSISRLFPKSRNVRNAKDNLVGDVAAGEAERDLCGN